MKKLSKPEFARLREKTRLVLAGRDSTDSYGFVNPPIVRGSTVIYPSTADFLVRKARYSYGTSGSPTIDALLAAAHTMEGGAGVLACSSGLLACTLPALAFLTAGDHFLVTDSVYHPMRNFCERMLPRYGVEVTYYDPLIGEGIAALFKPNTRAVWTESPGSQTLEVQDIPAIVAAAHARDIMVMMDNTWATPLLFDAHSFGVDVSVQAGTKYYAGHSDVLIGTVSARTPELYKQLQRTWDALGVIIAPEDAYLTLRGIRTLAIRLKELQPAGLEMANWLVARPEVARVLHPAMPDDPGHAIWKRDFTGACSLFSIELEPVSMKAVAAMLDGLTLFGMGASWGGYESLVLPFDCTRYRTATKPGFKGPTIRFHIGLEDLEDLKEDLDAGFARLRAAS
ncbi:cystathionine beta-lyase [Bosea sp. LjRoot237]|uniref:cystathionine beta-lyase n=1 Tax=Bosea sp. LjRoot237 TaxID=3342292 RepID=UPI003ECD8150